MTIRDPRISTGSLVSSTGLEHKSRALLMRVPYYCTTSTSYNILQHAYHILHTKEKFFLWPGGPQRRIYYHSLFGLLSSISSKATVVPDGQITVAIDHNQLRTMASETLMKLPGCYPTLYRAPLPQYKSMQPQPEIEPATFCIRSNRLAYAASQGMNAYHIAYILHVNCVIVNYIMHFILCIT